MDGSTWNETLADTADTIMQTAKTAAEINYYWQASQQQPNAGAPVQTPQQAALIQHQVDLGRAQARTGGAVPAASQWSLGSLGLGAGNNTLMLLLVGGLVLYLVLKK
jgi:hypothetical protein